MQSATNLHENSIIKTRKARSTPGFVPCKSQVSKQAIGKWSTDDTAIQFKAITSMMSNEPLKMSWSRVLSLV